MSTLGSGCSGGQAIGGLLSFFEGLIVGPPRIAAGAAVAFLLAAGAPASAQEPQRVAVGGLDVYWGILPAAMVLGHEAEHGGSKAARGAHHLVVALFSAATGARVTDAEVEARVEPLGLAAESKQLEPMTINRTVTFGNYFSMPGTGPYRITVRIRPEGSEDWVETGFEYRHGAGG